MLNLRTEKQGCIHSFKLSSVRSKYGQFSLWSIVFNFQGKIVRNGHIQSQWNILAKLF